MVQSQTTVDEIYEIDLLDQLCSCSIGSNGSICKHLYGAAFHFQMELMSLPPQTSETRQLIALVALGDSEDIDFYAGLRGEHTTTSRIVDIPAPSTPELQPCTNVNGAGNPSARKEEILRVLEDTLLTFKNRIAEADDVLESLLSAFRKFGVAVKNAQSQTAIESLLIGRALKKPSLGKRMHVQPTAVSRRVTKNGSSNPQKRGARPTDLVLPTQRRKRPHNLCKAVANNHANSFKH